ncbi:orotate phosphoribosyltransferase [Candidatus Calescamantes bacterium]|nr:orotate phosphoribosyltransferase [Candidatus Calescamantes bacterium]
MREEEILEIFEEKGALLRGHFRLSSGLHSDIYIQCALVLQYPHLSTKLCEELGKRFKDKKIEVVIGPAIGGIIVSHEVARYLSIRSLFAERKEGVMQLRRGFHIEKGEKVLLVEDVITTGKSLQEVEDIVKESGGIITGVGCLVDRSGGKSPFGEEIISLLSLKVRNWEPSLCPLCKERVPITTPGSRFYSP